MSKLLALLLAVAPTAAFAQAAPSPYTSGTRYDAAGRVTGTISADPDTVGSGNPFLAVRNSYDGAGRLTKVETGSLSVWQPESVAPANWGAAFTVSRTLETMYDAVGHKIRETLREGAAGPVRTLTQYSYDNAGRLECTAVRMNPAIYGSLPASACTPGTTGSDGPDRITRTLYDAAGQRLQLREGIGSAVEGTEATWAYNANGQVTTVIDGNGNRATLQYDGHGRQSGWTFPSTTRAAAFDDSTPALALATAGSVGSLQELYGYDPNGNRTSLTKRDGRTIAFAYDALNRVTAKTYPQGGATPVYYGYDLRNLQTSARFNSSSGEGITNAFDGFARLSSTSSNMGGNTRALTYQYDPNGNRTRITHPDGNYFTTTYDGLNRPLALQANASTTIAANEYAAHGGLWVVNRIGQATEINYDNVQRPYVLHHYLPTAGDVYWVSTFNPAGQVNATTRTNDGYAWTGHYAVNRAYATNGLNQYSGAGDTSLAYDDNGNLITSGSNAYVYDIENRMVGAPGTIVLSYDPLGRLFQASTPSTTTQFLYDGDAMVAEYNGSNVLQRRHVHNVGADVPMATYTVSGGTGLGTISQLFADRQGSIVAQLTSGGVSTGLNTYDEYGIPGASNSGRFQYTGQIWLPEIGMYYYKARIYSPTLGRFMQADPIGYDDQFNLYAYVGNDPVNATDPSGTITDRDSDQDRPSRAFVAPIAARTLPIAGTSALGTATLVVGAPLLLSGDTPQHKYVYATYTKPNPQSGRIYSGRASMRVPAMTPVTRSLGQRIVNCRECGHHMTKQGFGAATLDQVSESYAAIRGREQQLIQFHGGAQSEGGTSGNLINGVNPRKLEGRIYMQASTREFGPLPDHSPRPGSGGGPW